MLTGQKLAKELSVKTYLGISIFSERSLFLNVLSEPDLMMLKFKMIPELSNLFSFFLLES